MDEPTSIDEVLATDERTRHFSGWGLGGGLLAPEDSLRYLQDAIARARLVAAVPEEVRQNFERVRKTFLYGLVEYDLFTVADDDAGLILESALRVRFLTYYAGEVTIIRGGEQRKVCVSSFDDLRKRLKREDMLVLRDGQYHKLSPGTSGLLRWARREGLLVGQRSARSDATMGRLRNYAAHPSGFHRLAPPDAARTLCRVAEFINKLWGADTPGGRVFPAPVERAPRIVAIMAGRFVTFSRVRQVREVDSAGQDGTFAVYLAAPEEDLWDFDSDGIGLKHRPGFQCTMFPCDLLWGPGSWGELVQVLDRFEGDELNDQVQHLDRVFVFRVQGEQIDYPRSPADFEACDLMDGSWTVIRADGPWDAWRHVRDHRGMSHQKLKDGQCPDCPVRELGRFESRAETARCLETIETDAVPR